LLLISSSIAVFAQEVYLCVWRNPERTMTKIFPDAKDYISASEKISSSQLQVIEKKIGFEVLPGQRDVFLFYEMTGEKGKPVGTIIAVTQKGEFGAIEIVFGLDTNLVIQDLYVQRTRERNQQFKKREFLDLFVGQKAQDALSFKKLYKGPETPGTSAVIRGLTKALITYDIVVHGGEDKGQ
jgi:hypothetical protein